jgi:hypothetical protein
MALLTHAAVTVAVDDDEGKSATLHLGTMGAWGEEYTCPTLQAEGATLRPGWIKQVEDFRERFDIDHDLGGQAVARIWGLAAHRGCIAAAFTTHPGDMVEYTIAAEERTTLIFSSTKPHPKMDHPFYSLWEPPKFSRDTVRETRGRVLAFTLGLYLETQGCDRYFNKLVYAAAACAIVENRDSRSLSLAHEALQRLSSASGSDLTEEISKCEMGNTSPTIMATSMAQLSGPGADIFEKCEICDSGIEWYSSREAQCAEGHMFGELSL